MKLELFWGTAMEIIIKYIVSVCHVVAISYAYWNDLPRKFNVKKIYLQILPSKCKRKD